MPFAARPSGIAKILKPPAATTGSCWIYFREQTPGRWRRSASITSSPPRHNILPCSANRLVAVFALRTAFARARAVPIGLASLFATHWLDEPCFLEDFIG